MQVQGTEWLKELRNNGDKFWIYLICRLIYAQYYCSFNLISAVNSCNKSEAREQTAQIYPTL